MTEVGLEWLLSVSATPMLIVTDAVLGCVLPRFIFLGGFFGRFLLRNPNWAASMDCRSLSRCGIASSFDLPEKNG
ncbi:MAG: hypothetical protein WBD61_05085 [Desulfobulbales bacterium]|jgi:hypothetical protein